MRKFTLALFIICLGTTKLMAQLEKGEVIGGVIGNVNGSFSTTNDYFGVGLRLNPYALYLVEKNMAIGLSFEDEFGYARFNHSDGQRQVTRSNNLLLTPEIRKYFGSSKLMPFAGLSTGLTIRHSVSNEWLETSVNTGFFLAPEAGFSWWLSDRTYLDVKGRYNLIDTNYPKHYRSFDINLGIGFKIFKKAE
ncbi:MAG: hypothetical protein IH597_03650 [Bacteroidales bacterium]|nr:hypothetical protein [Bacteroidales bacterium]